MPDTLINLFDLSPSELRDHITAIGLPGFRADQLRQWVYEKHVGDLAAMTNLSQADRLTIARAITIGLGKVVKQQQASDATRKLLLAWPDQSSSDTTDAANPLPQLTTASESMTECVMIPVSPGPGEAASRTRRTACVSTQIGCPVGCQFCASGLDGLSGNLTAGQIVEQAWRLGQLQPLPRQPADTAGPITNIVFMGMGEPLANFNAVARAIDLLTDAKLLNIAARRITVSTVGLPAQIRRLAELKRQITLAISLHAPNDALRQQIIPWAQRVGIDQLIDAGRYYFATTGREVTLEYIMLGDLNDRPEHARQLADVASKLRSNVNLIRYNQVPDLPYQRPDDDAVQGFQKVLRGRGINCHIRASRGRDIDAACGQLRRRESAS